MAGYNKWGLVALQLQKECTDLVAQTAENGQTHVQTHMLANGQYRSGFMHDAVYANTSRGSSYGATGTPPGDSYLLPEAGPAGPYTAYYGCAANYSVYQNYGT